MHWLNLNQSCSSGRSCRESFVPFVLPQLEDRQEEHCSVEAEQNQDGNVEIELKFHTQCLSWLEKKQKRKVNFQVGTCYIFIYNLLENVAGWLLPSGWLAFDNLKWI